MKEDRIRMVVCAFIILAFLALTARFERVEPDEQDCLARGKSESCMTEVHGE